MCSRRSLFVEQLPHTTPPQLRQWCRRAPNMLKAEPQLSHDDVDESGRQTAAKVRPWSS